MKNHNLTYVGILFLWACFVPSLLHANSLETIRKLKTTYDKVKNLSADFHQTIRFLEFDTESISTGKVFLKKGKMRWDYLSPDTQQFFIDGDTLLHYLPEQNQVMKGRIGSQTGLPIDLFTGMDKIETVFQISEKGPNEIILVPKEIGSQMAQMVLTLIPEKKTDGLLIQKIEIEEENGNRSFFVFKAFQINKTFREDPFIFHLPKGVEVIEIR